MKSKLGLTTDVFCEFLYLQQCQITYDGINNRLPAAAKFDASDHSFPILPHLAAAADPSRRQYNVSFNAPSIIEHARAF